MRKLVRCVLFLMLVAVGIGLLGKRTTLKAKHTIYDEPKNTIDLVFVGSSACYTYWCPQVAYEENGIVSFVYGEGAMPAECLEYVIREVEKTQNPKVVMIDASVFLYHDNMSVMLDENGNTVLDGWRATADSMPFGLNKIKMIYNSEQYLHDGLGNYLDLIYYHDRWKELLAQDQPGLWEKRKTDNTKGYDFHYDCIPYEHPGDYRMITEEQAFSQQAQKVLRELCAYCEKQDFATLFVAVPMANASKEQKMQYNFLARIVGEYDGLNFINGNDLTDEIGMNYETDLVNETHANFYGADAFTKYMSVFLQENYELPNRKGEEVYASYEADVELWWSIYSTLIDPNLR